MSRESSNIEKKKNDIFFQSHMVQCNCLKETRHLDCLLLFFFSLLFFFLGTAFFISRHIETFFS